MQDQDEDKITVDVELGEPDEASAHAQCERMDRGMWALTVTGAACISALSSPMEGMDGIPRWDDDSILALAKQIACRSNSMQIDNVIKLLALTAEVRATLLAENPALAAAEDRARDLYYVTEE